MNTVRPINIQNNKCGNWIKLKSILGGFGCNMDTCSATPGNSLTATTASVSSMIQTPSEFVLDLSYKPSDESPIYYDGSTKNKDIKVTRSEKYEFYKYKHEHKDSNVDKFKFIVIQDDSGKPIPGPTNIDNVTSVSAYYWKYDNGGGHAPKKALLVGVSTGLDGTTQYYRNTKKGTWETYQLRVSSPGQPTQSELDLLNCEINDVVQIDVTKTGGEYCHDGNTKDKHANKKVKVTETGKDKLGNYTAYEHAPNSALKISDLNISDFKKGGQKIQLKGLKTLPINTNRVIVYFCRREVDTGTSAMNPLLIYLPNSDQGERWFKKPEDSSNEWKPASSLKNSYESDYTKIIDVLDKLQSPCKPPEITMDIYERSLIGGTISYYDESSGKNICSTSKFSDVGDFTKCTHNVQDRDYFTLNQIKFNNNSTNINGRYIQNVITVLVYYWSFLETPLKKGTSRPLLIKVTTKVSGGDASEKYYENTDPNENLKWDKIQDEKVKKLREPDGLKKKLQLLNCKLNDALIIDVSMKPISISTYNYDACNEYDKRALGTNHDHAKIKVERDSKSLRNYEVYTHKLRTPSDGKVFHIVGFKNDKTPITEIGSLPILDIKEVRVYFCQLDGKPLLLYYKTGNTHNWYKNNGDATTGKWEPAEHGLSDNTDPDSYDNIKKVLDSLGSICKPQPAAAPPSPKEPLPGKPSDRESQGPAQLPEAEVAALAGVVPAATSLWLTFGTSSGTLAGAGSLTGLGWWAFKRSKGDPWVRQI